MTIAQIREMCQAADGISTGTREQMLADSRAGVRKLVESLELRHRQAFEENARIKRILRFERTIWRAGHRCVAGVDEAGIGPLAGPVVAAAAVFPQGALIEGVDDSKKLDRETREALAASIEQQALDWAIGSASVAEIDRLNIYHAALLAMRRAIEGLTQKPQFVLSDARRIPGIAAPQRPLVKGDRRCFSIAAASILAKVHRDRLMRDLDRHYPLFGFSRHKGYPTAAHCEAISRHGACKEHRRSFPIVSELIGDCSRSYYSLKNELATLTSSQDADRFADRLRQEAPCLSKPELQRLRQLFARRRKAIAKVTP